MKKHIVFILIVLIISIVVVLAIKYSGSFNNIWLWIIGLCGPIIAFFKESFSKLGDLVKKFDTHFDSKQPVTPAIAYSATTTTQPLSQTASIPSAPAIIDTNASQPQTKNVEIKVLRYVDDGNTTLGLLYIDDQFYCYTLEDSYHEIKITDKTRIPAGTYNINFIKEETPLTKRYRELFPWFTYHLEIQNVPGFVGVYIHNGGTSEHTSGCLLVANGIYSADATKMLKNSVITYTAMYKLLSNKLNNNFTITLKIYNENWIKLIKPNIL
jgi:hypothetical protein